MAADRGPLEEGLAAGERHTPVMTVVLVSVVTGALLVMADDGLGIQAARGGALLAIAIGWTTLMVRWWRGDRRVIGRLALVEAAVLLAGPLGLVVAFESESPSRDGGDAWRFGVFLAVGATLVALPRLIAHRRPWAGRVLSSFARVGVPAALLWLLRPDGQALAVAGVAAGLTVAVTLLGRRLAQTTSTARDT